MLRWAFIILAFLVVLGALALGWASTAPRHINMELFQRQGQWAHLSAYNGQLWVMHNSLTSATPRLFDTRFDLPGLRVSSSIHRPMRVTIFSCPSWFPALLFGFIVGTPLAVVWRRRARWRFLGLCRHCGYDLTGLIEPRCPECGRPVKPRRASKVDKLASSKLAYPIAILLLFLLAGWGARDHLRQVVSFVTGAAPPAPSSPFVFPGGGKQVRGPSGLDFSKARFEELAGPPAPGYSETGGWLVVKEGNQDHRFPIPPDRGSAFRPDLPP